MLETIPVFSCLSEKEIRDLETEAVKKSFPKNTVLFSEGDETDSLYVITSGKVKAVITDETRPQKRPGPAPRPRGHPQGTGSGPEVDGE